MRPVFPPRSYINTSADRIVLSGPGRRMPVGSKPPHCRGTGGRRKAHRRTARLYIRSRNAPGGNARRAFVAPRAKSCASSSCLFGTPPPASSLRCPPLVVSYERGRCRRDTRRAISRRTRFTITEGHPGASGEEGWRKCAGQRFQTRPPSRGHEPRELVFRHYSATGVLRSRIWRSKSMHAKRNFYSSRTI